MTADQIHRDRTVMPRNRTYQLLVEWALDQLDRRRGIWRPNNGEPWHMATETLGEHPGSEGS